jgi:hypothetical protein
MAPGGSSSVTNDVSFELIGASGFGRLLAVSDFFN